MRTPEPLKSGDVVQIVAPASPFVREKVLAGVSILKAFGLRPQWRADIFSTADHLAGDDARRAAELVEAFTTPGVAAVLPARGGFGCARTCRAIGSPDGFLPRAMVGFSDITTLHCWLSRDADMVTFHGPNVSTLSSLDPPTLERYRRTLFGIEPARNFSWDGLACIRGGRATGPTLIANLTVLVSLAGTPFEPDLAGRILVLEDLNEPPYRLDRMLFQLSFMRGFSSVAAVVLGDFMLGGEDVSRFSGVVAGYAERWDVPVASGIPVGHGLKNDCVPVGVGAELDADRGRLFVKDPWS